jgi:arylsulfatase A-like enzyme
VLFNGVLERPGLGVPVKVDPRKDKLELVQVPTLFDVLHQAGKTSAGVNWPCTRNAKTLAIDFPDSPETLDHTTPELIAELKQSGAVSEEEFQKFGSLSAPARDRIWTQAACHIVRTQKPNLLMFHLLNVDGTHHKYGPKSAPSYSAVAFADSCVGELLRAIDDAGIADSTAVIIGSDHGFMTIPKSLRPNVLLKNAGLLTAEGGKVATARAFAITEGGTALVYLTSPDTADADQQKAIAAFKEAEGIEAVLTPDAFAEYGLPTPSQSRQAPDLVLAAKDGYGFNGNVDGDDFVVVNEGTPGTHGFLSTNPRMNAVFVAAGAGIQPKTRLGVIENVSVAPTIAALLDVSLLDVDGTPLDDVLADEAAASK